MTLTLSLAIGVAAFSQTDAEADTKTFTADEIDAILGAVEINTIKNTSDKTNHCEDTITTPLLSGNGQDGVMFDVVIGGADLIIETFWVSIDVTDSVLIYYRAGTFVGNETSSAGWIYLGGNITTGTGDGLIAQIPVSLAFPVTNGTTYGFYVTTANGGMNYTNGTTVGATLVSNTDLSILEGNGGGYPFNVTFSPRTFNGRVQYCQTGVGVSEILGNSNVSIYPNPASNELNIKLPLLSGKVANVTIYNTLGSIVMTEVISANGTTSTFDISSLNSGIYFVKLAVDGLKYSSKLFVD